MKDYCSVVHVSSVYFKCTITHYMYYSSNGSHCMLTINHPIAEAKLGEFET